MRNELGHFEKGIIPKNKIVIPEEKLRMLYEKYGATIIARQLNISKQTVLRNLHEYNIPMRKQSAPNTLPEYWRTALEVPKTGIVWSKGQTKETNEGLMKISKSLSGERNIQWKPELHTGEQVKCACGCGQFRVKFDKRGRERLYIVGHSRKGQYKNNDPRISGINSNHWKGGVTPVNCKIRRSTKYKNWRRTVYVKDEYTCQMCRQKHIDIVAHHIKSFTDYPKLRFEPENGIVLCRSCHLSLHRRLNRGRGGCKTTRKTGKR